jgi:hypothetical protein
VKAGVARFERELRADLALADLVLARPDVFPAVPPEPEQVVIRTDAASVDAAIMRGLVLALDGTEVNLKLEEERDKKSLLLGSELIPHR